jgi:hypothetical protein
LHGILEYNPQADYAFYTTQARALLSEIEPERLQVSSLSPR